ncbi:MAG: hypothetical protein HOP36_02905 [Methyloglobulus sp.]|nr:hypothetical protein [Methyloglobulus sp.]
MGDYHEHIKTIHSISHRDRRPYYRDPLHRAVARSVRGNTRIQVNRNGNFDRNRAENRLKNIDRNRNIKRNVNINRNTSVNVNRNVNDRHGYYGGRYHDDGIGVGAAIAIGVAGLAVGSIVTAASMSPSCQMVNVNGFNYQRCGSTWY